MKQLYRILKRNYKLNKINKLYKKLNLRLIKDEDNAFQRNMKAINYIDNIYNTNPSYTTKTMLEDIREILTSFRKDNIYEVNK